VSGLIKSIGSIDEEQKVWFKCPEHGGESYFSNTNKPKIVPVKCFCGHKYVVYVKDNNPPDIEPDKFLKQHLLKLAQRRLKATKAAELLNIMPEVEVKQPNTKLVEAVGNRFVYNLFSVLATQIAQATQGQYVEIEGTVRTPIVSGTNLRLDTMPSSATYGHLGSDTNTPTVRELWRLVSPVSHPIPSKSVAATIVSKTYAGVTYNAVVSINMAYSWSAGWNPSNPTIGELALAFTIVVSGATPAGVVSRLSAADGEFTPFTAVGSLPLTVAWRWKFYGD